MGHVEVPSLPPLAGVTESLMAGALGLELAEFRARPCWTPTAQEGLGLQCWTWPAEVLPLGLSASLGRTPWGKLGLHGRG